jgi:hypothetical protein
VLRDVLKDDYCIFKNNQDTWGEITPLKAFLMFKMEPFSFSCTFSGLCIVSFLESAVR